MEALMNYNPHLGYKEEVIQQYQRMTWMVAGRFKWAVKRFGIPFEDLISEANVGLLKAFNRYNPDSFIGVTKFSTYAIPMMHGEIQRFLRDTGHTIRPTRKLYYLVGRIIKNDLKSHSAFEISSELGCTPHEANEALRFLRESVVVSVDQPIEGEKEETLLQLIKSNADFTEIDVRQFLASLSEAERRVVHLRLEGKLQKEIAKSEGVSQMTVSRTLSLIGKKLIAFWT